MFTKKSVGALFIVFCCFALILIGSDVYLYKDKNDVVVLNEEYTVSVGEFINYTIDKNGWYNSSYFIYCGMVNDSIFTITPNWGNFGINIFIPTSVDTFIVHERAGATKSFKLIYVDPMKLTVEVLNGDLK